MINKTIYPISIIMSFLMGVLITYLIMTKQKMDAIFQGQSPVVSANDNNQDNQDNHKLNPNLLNPELFEGDISEQKLSQRTDLNNISADDQAGVSINDYSETEVKKLVNNMPNYMINQYVDKFMAKGASNVIADKRRFAERAVEELYNANDNQPMVGVVKLALNSVMPDTSQDTSKIKKFAKLYAHLDTEGQIPASPYVFVKWVNNDTGQILLFEKKNITENSNQNWVSFKPDDGWQIGSYDVRFYQFTSELEPIAQTTYQIYEVE